MAHSGEKKEVIKLDGVHVDLGGHPVLEDINLTVYERDYLGVIGPNGSGKTTLLKVVLGLIRPDRGRVLVFDEPPSRAAGRIGYVPQYDVTDPMFPVTVREVVMMGRLSGRGLFRRYTAEDREIAESALAKVEMEELADRQVGRLSGGQRQRVLIARALAVRPDALLLDEPAASLDTTFGRNLFELLDELNREITIVMVTHDIGVLSKHVKSVACISRRLFTHDDPEHLDRATMEKAYGCPIELIAHGMPHRVFDEHVHEETDSERDH